LESEVPNPLMYRYKNIPMTHNYTTITAYSNKFNIWLVNKQGDVFIKIPAPSCPILEIKDLTIVARDKESLLEKIESEWKVPILKNNIRKLYNFKTKIDGRYIQITGYISSLHMSLKEQNLLCARANGKFINYRDIESKIKGFDRDAIFIEGYSELLKELDNQFGWFSHLNKIYKRSV
jgi:hypothetical protein